MRLSQESAREEHIGRRDLARWPSVVGRWLVQLTLVLARFASANTVLVVSVTIGAVLVTGLTAASAEIYDAVEDGDGISGLDRPVLDAFIAMRTATNVKMATVFTHLGGPLWMSMIASCVTVALTLLWRSRTPLMLMVIAVAGSLTMTGVGKVVVGRIRPPLSEAVPPLELSPSFPSGHTLNSTVIAGVVAYLVLRRLESTLARVATVACAAGWAVAMGLSRVFLGHHWLTDVAVGWTLGLAWVGVVVTAHRLFLTVRRSHQARDAAALRT